MSVHRAGHNLLHELTPARQLRHHREHVVGLVDGDEADDVRVADGRQHEQLILQRLRLVGVGRTTNVGRARVGRQPSTWSEL